MPSYEDVIVRQMLYTAFSAVKVRGVTLFEHLKASTAVDDQVKAVALKVVRHIQDLIYLHIPAKDAYEGEDYKTELVKAKERLSDYIDSFLKEVEYLKNMWARLYPKNYFPTFISFSEG